MGSYLLGTVVPRYAVGELLENCAGVKLPSLSLASLSATCTSLVPGREKPQKLP